MNHRRTLVASAVCLVALLAGVSISADNARAGQSGRGDGGGDSDTTLRAELDASAGGAAQFAARKGSGGVTFIGGSADNPLQAPLDAADGGGDLSAVGRHFVGRYGTLFGAASGTSNLAEAAAFAGRTGVGGALRYQQMFHGVPVIAGQVAVQIDAAGAVVSATGRASAGLNIGTTATVSSDQAAATAVLTTVRRDGATAAELTASAPELSIYDPALIGVVDDLAGPRLVWRTDVRTALGEIDRYVLIDAHTGYVALTFSQRNDFLSRQVCDNNESAALGETCVNPVRTEGQPPIPGSTDANWAYDLSGVTYNFYMNNFGRDSLDGHGMMLKSTVRFCPSASACPYANAYWNGAQMVYGQNYASAVDVVGHELTHGLTDHTSALLYYADSGAINESMSDVMGELIQQGFQSVLPANKWLLGEQLPGGPIRSMKDPTAYFDPDKMTSPYFHFGRADDNGVHTNSGVNNKAAYLMAQGDTFNGQTVIGLGNAKTAAIYYQAETTLLTPGSDYADLFNILPQACTNLLGTTPVGGTIFTASDCQQVSKAVVATEMNLHPTTGPAGGEPAAYLPAPLCGAGTVQNTIGFSDDMENPQSGNWSTAITGGGAPWLYTTTSSQSGSHSIHVSDAGGPRGISSLTANVRVPISTGPSYLRFDHSFSTDGHGGATPGADTMYDGGVVEYTTDGATWQDISTLPGTINGYNGTLIDDPQPVSPGAPPLANELAGRAAFGITSPNYQTTRVDLTSLAGSSVGIRFRFSTDNFPGRIDEFPGWFIDDVSIYGCGAAQAPGAPRSVVATPGDHAATLTWAAPFGDGGSPIIGYTVTEIIDGVAQTPVDTPSTTLPFTGLLDGTTYRFRVVARNALGSSPATESNVLKPPYAPFVSLLPTRLLETRDGHSTVDGRSNGIGLRTPGSVMALTVAGRGGVAADAEAVVLNVTVTEAQAPGYVTLYPCGANPPTASNLNYVTGSTIPNLVVVRVGAGGQVCLYTQSSVQLVADVSGYFPPNSSLTSLLPARLLDSRPGNPTADGQGSGIGLRPAGSVTEVQVAGRAGIPADATAAVLNVTVTEAGGPGYATVYPCGSPPPTASNLNYVAGQTIPDAVVSKIGAAGKVCIFTQQTAHLIADVSGYFPADSTLIPLVPARLLESRGSGPTVDGQSQNIGVRPPGSVTEVVVAGRGGVPAAATAVVLNVTVTESQAAGYATVYPCGGQPPTASNLNYGVGTTIANAVITKIGAGGKVCIFTQQATHLLADVNAYFAS